MKLDPILFSGRSLSSNTVQTIIDASFYMHNILDYLVSYSFEQSETVSILDHCTVVTVLRP